MRDSNILIFYYKLSEKLISVKFIETIHLALDIIE